MENIEKFLKYCYSKGCKKVDMFQTVDLYEGQNIPQVSLSGNMANEHSWYCLTINYRLLMVSLR